MKYVVHVEGMMCHGCENHVNLALSKLEGVKKVKSNHLKNETIIVSKKELDEELILSTIKEAGYEAKEIVRK